MSISQKHHSVFASALLIHHYCFHSPQYCNPIYHFSNCAKRGKQPIDVVVTPSVYDYLLENLIAKDEVKQATNRYTHRGFSIEN